MTVVRLNDTTKEDLENYRDEHGLNSIDEAVDQILQENRERSYTIQERFPGYARHFENVHQNLGVKESYPIPPEFARTIMHREHKQGNLGEDEWVSRLFSIVHRSQFLLDTETIPQTDVLHVYEIGAMGYAFILSKLNVTSGNIEETATSGKQRVWGWACSASFFPDDLARILDTNDFLAPTRPIPERITYRGYTARLSDVVQSHPEVTNELQTLPTYAQFLDEFYEKTKESYGVSEDDFAYENPDASDGSPEKRIDFAESSERENARESFVDEGAYSDLLNQHDPLINPYNPFRSNDAYVNLSKVLHGSVQTKAALMNKFKDLFDEPPTWAN